MIDHETLVRLREVPTEWRRRGLTPPSELARMVESRVNDMVFAADRDVVYADFFVA